MIKKHYKDILVVALVLVVLLTVGFTVDFKSVDEYYGEALSPSNENNAVYLSIDVKTILANESKLDSSLLSYLPKDGVILTKLPYALKSDDTAFSLLKRITAYKRIQLEYKGTTNAYIEGIANFYEFSCGDNSGWIYLVNSKQPNVSASNYKLKVGDVVEWRFSCNNGQDVGGL